MQRTIRPVVLGVFRHKQHILVFEAYDHVKDEVFYRPLGGGIEFGEHSRDALVREIREELDTAIMDIHLLGTLENVFVHRGEPGHEIVLIYEAAFADAAHYTRDNFLIHDGGEQTRVRWMPLALFAGPDAPPLYPTGLYALLMGGETRDSSHTE